MKANVFKLQLQFRSIEDVKKFVTDVANLPFDINILSGSYVIDGKSIMGIFSLDLSKPVECQLIADRDYNVEDFRKLVSYVVLN